MHLFLSSKMNMMLTLLVVSTAYLALLISTTAVSPHVYAIDAATGARLWSYTTGNAICSFPAIVNGVVCIGPYDNTLYTFHLPGTSPGMEEG